MLWDCRDKKPGTFHNCVLLCVENLLLDCDLKPFVRLTEQ